MRLPKFLLLMLKFLPIILLGICLYIDLTSGMSSPLVLLVVLFLLPVVSFIYFYLVFHLFFVLPSFGRSVLCFIKSTRVLYKYCWVVLLEEAFLRWLPIRVLIYSVGNLVIIPIIVSFVFVAMHYTTRKIYSYKFIKHIEFVSFFLLTGVIFHFFPFFLTLFMPHWIRNSFIQLFANYETGF